jgi:hypothetical protein
VWGRKPDWQGRDNEFSFAQAVQRKLLKFDLSIWQQLDRGQINDNQALQKFKAENDRQAREAIAQGVAEGLNELTNTSLKVKQPKDFVNTNDRKQVTWKVMKFKSGKDTYLINFTMQHPPAFGKKSKSNWNAVNVAFGVKEPQDEYSFGDEINTDLTARNKNQFLIYSTVINAVRKFITEYNTEIDEIIMQGAGERQQAMYQRFFQSAGKYFPGWHYNGKHSLVRDVPRQPVKKVREQGVTEGKDFDRCFDQACKLYDRAVSKNLEPKLVQVADFQGDGNGADPRWMKLPQHVWQHYVVIVGDQVLDPTAKQFGDTMPTQYQVSDLDRIWGKQYQIRPSQDVAEGEVVPFKQPSKTLTWQQVPKDVLLLANDWLWAEYDNTGLDAVMDPKGFGNGTANELQYITAKLQQKGWTIDHNDENDGPDEYNLILTNKRGQTVLLSIEDAQTFSGWAKGTSSYGLEEGVDPFRSLLIAVRQDAGHYLDTKGQAGGRNFILDINQRLIQLERTGNPRAKIISSTVRDLMDIAQRSSVNTKGVSFGTLAHTLMQLTQQELRKVDTQQDMAEGEEIVEGPFVQRLGRPNKVNVYVRHAVGKPSLLIATDIPYAIYDKFIAKAMQKYPQFRQTDFSFKSSDKITEFAPPGSDDREPDEEEVLRKLAAQWWNGSIQQMKKAQQTLEAMGWDIGLDQSGDDDAGVFVIRIGDIHGDSYIAFPHSELGLNEDYLDEN